MPQCVPTCRGLSGGVFKADGIPPRRDKQISPFCSFIVPMLDSAERDMKLGFNVLVVILVHIRGCLQSISPPCGYMQVRMHSYTHHNNGRFSN